MVHGSFHAALEDLKVIQGEGLGFAGQFMVEQIEVDLYPIRTSAKRPLSFKDGFADVLLQLHNLGPETQKLGNLRFLHLLARRIIEVGIPTNPIQIHLMKTNHGYITIESPFDPKRWPDRFLQPKWEEQATILRALELAGLVRTHLLPNYGVESVPLPAQEYGPEDWPQSWSQTCEQPVWSFRV